MPTFDNPFTEKSATIPVDLSAPVAVTFYPAIEKAKGTITSMHANVTTAVANKSRFNLGDGVTATAYGYIEFGPLAVGHQAVTLPNINALPSYDGGPLVLTPVAGTGVFDASFLLNWFS